MIYLFFKQLCATLQNHIYYSLSLEAAQMKKTTHLTERFERQGFKKLTATRHYSSYPDFEGSFCSMSGDLTDLS